METEFDPLNVPEPGSTAYRSRPVTGQSVRRSFANVKWHIVGLWVVATLAFLGMIAAIVVGSLAFQRSEEFWISNHTDSHAMVTRGRFHNVALKKDPDTNISVIEFCNGVECSELEGALEASLDPVTLLPVFIIHFSSSTVVPVKANSKNPEEETQ